MKGEDSGQTRSPKVAPRNFTAVFLDRDGVLNVKMPEGQYVCSQSDFRMFSEVPQAIARLNRAGKLVLVVSNQRGVALGLCTENDVEAIHSRLKEGISSEGAHIDAVYFCPHDKGTCECRKPLRGMYDQARHDFSEIAASSSIMIGDSPSDIEFGQRLGMFTILIEREPVNTRDGSAQARALADRVYGSLSEAVDYLLSAQEP